MQATANCAPRCIFAMNVHSKYNVGTTTSVDCSGTDRMVNLTEFHEDHNIVVDLTDRNLASGRLNPSSLQLRISNLLSVLSSASRSLTCSL